MAEYDDDLDPSDVEYIYQLRKESSRAQASWRSEARESYEFRDGSQWDSTDMAIMEEQRRPVVVFNRVAPIIDSIVGYELNNRQEIRYLPRTMEDRATTSIFSEASRWVRDQCDAEDEESDAYSDAITCGMGWMETRVDYEETPDGRIVMERVPPMQMRWDHNARKNNLADMNWVMREQWLDISDIKERWPDKADDIVPMADQLMDNEWIDEHDASESWKYEQDQTWTTYDEKTGKGLVIHYQYREREAYYRVGDPESGRIVEFEPSRFERLKERLDAMDVPYVKQNRWVYKQKFLVGQTVLEEGPTPVDGHFSFHCITAKRDEEEGWWYGLMRVMKDPQRWANAFFSQAMFSFQANSKGGVIVEDGAVDDRRSFEEQWASPDGVIYVEDGALQGGRIQEKSFGGYPPSLDKLLQFAIASIRDCSGVNLEMLGMAGREQPGILEQERKKAALVILAPLINSLRRYRKMQGRALLEFMRRYIPEGTVMRVSNKPVPFWRDDDTVEYDVVVDQAPNSPNLKQEVWEIMSNIAPAMIKAGVPLPPDLVKFSPLPDSVADEWARYIEERSAMPDVEGMNKQMEQMSQEIQKLQEENKGLSDKRQSNQEQLAFKWQEAQLEARIREMEIAQKQRQVEMELAWKAKLSDADRAAKLIEINAKYEAEMAKLQSQSSLQRETTQAKLQNDREVQIVSIEAEREKRRIEREEKMEKDINPHIERIEGTEKLVEQVAEDFESYRKEAEERRNIILEYIKSYGGEAAQLAQRLK